MKASSQIEEEHPARGNYPRDACIHELFEEQVRLTPSAVAVQIGEKRLTYSELNQAAENVADELRKLGVCADTLVGIYLPRSFSLIVGLLAILKAGGAYVALNEGDPRPHLASIIEGTRMPVLLTGKQLLSLLPYDSGFAVCLDSDGAITTTINCGANTATSQRSSPTGDDRRATALSLAYVSFTSGSTGPPKGVCVTHRGVVRLVRNTNYARFGPEEVFLLWSRISFDLSTFEIWGPLLNGARLVVFPPEPVSHSVLRDLIRSQGVTTLWLTAGLFHQIVERDVDILQGVRQLLVGGDVLSKPLVQIAAERLKDCQLINGYGPTENTTFTCCYTVRLPLPDIDSVPIGRPISNTSVYVIDSSGERVPFGEAGELATGGDGLARGYLNSPALTDEKFISVRFDDAPELLYRTGDRARFLPDGNLEFLGRIDRQVKVRGFRVELTAIEAVLARHNCVCEAAVLAQGEAGHKRLEAYIVPKAGTRLTNSALRELLRHELPDYMIPSDFFYLNEMPLTPNCKVDYKALPSLRHVRELGQDQETTLPETPTEKALAQLWGEALGLQEVDIDRKFFDLGGDSLQAVGFVLSVEQKHDKRLPLAAVGTGTIRSLAAILDRTPLRGNELGESIVPMNNQPMLRHGPPFFFVPGQAGDELNCYMHVVENLPPGQSVYGLQPVDGREFETIEETAEHYVEILRQNQVSGPYFLGGFCFGALVAFEMAQQLRALGERVDFLAILDHRWNSGEPAQFRWGPRDILKFFRNLFYAAADFWEVKEEREASLRRLLARMLKPIKRIWTRADQRFSEIDEKRPLETSAAPSFSTGDQARQWWIQERAACRYQPRSYAGPVTLFRSRRLPLEHPCDESLGWSKISVRGLDIQKISVPGFQGCMLWPRYASVLANRLGRALELAQRESALLPTSPVPLEQEEVTGLPAISWSAQSASQLPIELPLAGGRGSNWGRYLRLFLAAAGAIFTLLHVIRRG